MSAPGAGRATGLTPRLILLLTLALLPLGAIAYWQNARILDAADRQAELTLLARTERAANPLQSILQRALGNAEAIGLLFDRLQDDPDDCEEYLSSFLRARTEYSFVGLLPPDGRMTCASRGAPFDFSTDPSFAASVEDPRTNVTVNPDAPISRRGVLIATKPIERDGAFTGFVSISVPVDSLGPALGAQVSGPSRPIGLITVNARGTILTSTFSTEETAAQLPADADLLSLVQGTERVRALTNAAGEARTYAVAALVPGVAYAIGTWPDGPGAGATVARTLRSSVIPVAMWATSLLVAIAALHFMVVRRVHGLSRQIRRFAQSRSLPAAPEMAGGPAELREIEADFRDMAASILQDEARLEDNLREKNVLLKEVHHRVKNNLQLISSIVNMEGRRVAEPAAAAPLRRLQDRVMGLALVHRALYQSDDLHRVDAGRLLREIAQQSAQTGGSLAPGVEIDGHAALEPDRAVPLALLTSEALTNAQRHGDGAARIVFEVEAGEGRLRIENPVDDPAPGEPAPEAAPRTLGRQLIRAFAEQIGGTLRTGRTEGGNYVLDLRFPIRTPKQPAKDY